MNNSSEMINELATALSKCQGEMSPAIKDSVNPHFKNKFATLYSIWEACREPLSKNGLSVVQTMDFISEKLCLTTKLMHSSGQWLSSTVPVISAKNDAQGIGSALSYFKRYSLSALLGICTADEDDDGNAAMPNDKEKAKAKEKPKAPPILNEQYKILGDLKKECEDSYLKKLYKHLKESHGIDGLENITQDIYPQVLNGMKNNAQLQKEKNV
jgi:hypothetical protein